MNDIERTVTREDREAALSMAVASHVGVGWRVEVQTATSATVVSGSKPNHVLHLILTLVTCGAWGFVWMGVALLQKEKRLTLTVDEWGRVQSTAPRG
jgi:hypothetical protein